MSKPQDETRHPATERDDSAIRLSDYFWRPRWVKAWWAIAALFWLAVFIDTWLPRDLSFDPSDGKLFWLALALHPFTIVPVLGYRMAWAWRRDKALFPWDPGYSDTSDQDQAISSLYDGTGMGFHSPMHMSYLSDPFDVRSPLNPASPAYKIINGEQ